MTDQAVVRPPTGAGEESLVPDVLGAEYDAFLDALAERYAQEDLEKGWAGPVGRTGPGCGCVRIDATHNVFENKASVKE